MIDVRSQKDHFQGNFIKKPLGGAALVAWDLGQELLPGAEMTRTEGNTIVCDRNSNVTIVIPQ